MPRPPDQAHDAMIRRRKRVVLGAAAVTVLVFMTYPVLTSFTGVLNGVADGVGAAYAVGLAVVVLPAVAAVGYRRWTSRLDGRSRR